MFRPYTRSNSSHAGRAGRRAARVHLVRARVDAGTAYTAPVTEFTAIACGLALTAIVTTFPSVRDAAIAVAPRPLTSVNSVLRVITERDDNVVRARMSGETRNHASNCEGTSHPLSTLN